MEFEEAKDRLYAVFPRLVIEDGLSVYEGMAYGLVRGIGMKPVEAAAVMSRLTGKDVTNHAVSKYVQKAREKYRDAPRADAPRDRHGVRGHRGTASIVRIFGIMRWVLPIYYFNLGRLYRRIVTIGYHNPLPIPKCSKNEHFTKCFFLEHLGKGIGIRTSGHISTRVC